MRNFLFAAAALMAATVLSGSKVEAAPFCSYIGGATGGFQSCGFQTWDQCLASIRGAGGFCMVNPGEAWSTRDVRRYPYR
jgi:hypothetical protein